jgi:ribonuclease VapC
LIVIDTSAIAAILFDEVEAEAEVFELLVSTASSVSMSAVTHYEARLIGFQRRGESLIERYDQLLVRAEISIVPFDEIQSTLAFQAYRRFGKGIHSARLDFADCAAYALAKSLDAPLLFKGNDFALTDVRVAA